MRWLVLAIALLITALAIEFGTFAASGADSYGYVSQADLWLQRTLIIEQPLGEEASWLYANWTLAPLGYRPGDKGGTMVPTYSPGLPILMAVFKAIAGPGAVFYVVPLLAGLAVWLTFVLGARVANPQAGALAAAALAASPAFLMQMMWPMSDLPAMTWWLASIVLALGGGWRHAAASGVAASLAILTRPNLVVLALPLLLLHALEQPTRRNALARAGTCALFMVPGMSAIAALNHYLYGSPAVSGYGGFADIYASTNLWPNLTRYPRWLIETQTPFVLLAFASPALLPRRRLAISGLMFVLTVFGAYMWYTPFDQWTYLRFLLPAFPVLLTLAAASFDAIFRRVPQLRATALLTVAAMLVGWGVWSGRGAFQVQGQESRYEAAGRLARGLPANAVVISNQHSGSLRYYGGCLTIRFEWLTPEAYGDALLSLRKSGKRVFAVLDEGERDIFRRRYEGVSDLSWLNEKPIVVAAGIVYFYEIPNYRER